MEIEQPSQEVFDDIKKCALEIWSTYDDTYWYATKKKDSIKDIENDGDNALYIVGMFDWANEARLLSLVSPKTEEYLHRNLQ